MKNILKLLILCSLVLAYSCKDNDNGKEPFESSFSVTDRVNKINTPGEGYSIPVEASNDVSWTANLPAGSENDWITLVTPSGKGNGSVIFNLKANEDLEKRSIEVIFTASSDRSSTSIPAQKCVVTQIGTAPDIELYPADSASVIFTANPEYTIAVTANVEWTASIAIVSGPDGWISMTSPATPVTGEGEIKLNVLENPGEVSRVAVVTVVSTTDPNLKRTFILTQQGSTPLIEISPSGTDAIHATADNAYTVQVTSNLEWVASIEINPADEAGWATITSPTGPSTGSGTISLDIKANNSTAIRTAILHISSTLYPSDNKLNKTLTITQIYAGARYTIFIANYTALATGTATMNISPYPSGTAQDITVDVTSDASGASIVFPQELPAGYYMINSLTYGSNPAVNVGSVFAANKVGMIVLVEHWDVAFNYFGGSMDERPIYINNLADLNTLRTAVNAGYNYTGVILKQMNDISLSGNWDPIGNAAGNPFAGIYDGNNFKIIGLFMSGGAAGALFGNIGGINADSVAVIKNLTVEGSGGDNADVTGSDAGTVAGVAAVVTANTLIDNCVNRANITAPGVGFIGGLAGTCTGNNITVQGCKNYGKILGTGGYSGGIVASLTSTETENIYITSCHNYGNLEIASTAGSVTGGIVGRSTNPTAAMIKWCSNRGNINLNGVNATNGTGGIIGSLLGNTEVQECFNLGVINTFTNTGGITGFMNLSGNNSSIKNCYNKGTIFYATRTAVNNGGIAGNLTNNWGATIECCYNAGGTYLPTTTADRYSGIASANTIPSSNLSSFSGVAWCFYETGLGYVGGLGGSVPPADLTDKAEGKATADMQSAIPYNSYWDTSIWQFAAGQYPALKNNPE